MKNKFFSLLAIFALAFSYGGFAIAQTLPADTTTTDTSTDTSMPAVEEPVEEPAPEMPVGPAISSVSVTDITDTSARIDVDSDDMVQGYVEYGTSEQYGMSTPLTSEFSTSPSFLLENLTPETLYHYRVIVMDSGGNAAITGDETFTTLVTPEPAPEPEPEPAPEQEQPTNTATSTTTATTTPPTTETETATTTPPAPALAVANTETATVSTSTARVIWQTNKSADAQVQYGTTNAYGMFSPVGAASFSHSVLLSGLTPNTQYHYRAISKTSDETAYSPAETFTTLAVQAAPTPPVISNVVIGSVSTSTATISWTTSKPATSDIQYGTTTSYAFSLGKEAAFKTSHSRIISNLKPSMLYNFRIRVTDSSGNAALGKNRTFTTVALPSGESAPASAGNNSDTLAKIAEESARVAQSAPRGGGGLPVAPTHPILLKVTPLDGQVAFDWRKDRGGKNGTIKTLIVRKQGTEAVRSRIDGEIIYDGPSTTFTDTNVENGKEYHYALYSYGQFGRFTSPAQFKVIPQADKEQVDLSAAEEEEYIPLELSRNLFHGRRGDDVRMLQTHLMENGFYPEGLITGYFGPLTRKAVIRYQALNGIMPAVGYVGPITRGVLAE